MTPIIESSIPPKGLGYKEDVLAFLTSDMGSCKVDKPENKRARTVANALNGMIIAQGLRELIGVTVRGGDVFMYRKPRGVNDED